MVFALNRLSISKYFPKIVLKLPVFATPHLIRRKMRIKIFTKTQRISRKMRQIPYMTAD